MRLKAIMAVCIFGFLPMSVDASSRPTAWDVLVVERPEILADTSLTSLERRVLQLLTPSQAEALSRGASIDDIRLVSGESLSGVLARMQREDESGQLYKPIAPCTVLDTRSAQSLSADQTHTLSIAEAKSCDFPGFRGEILRSHTARSIFLQVQVIDPANDGELRLWPANDHPRPDVGLVNFQADTAAVVSAVVSLCDEIGVDPCRAGDLNLHIGTRAHVVLTAIGYFEPARPAVWESNGVSQVVGGKEGSSTVWEQYPGTDDVYYAEGKVAIGTGAATNTPNAQLHVWGEDGVSIKQPHTIHGDDPYFDYDHPTLTLDRGSSTVGVTLAMGKSNKKFYLTSTGNGFAVRDDGQSAMFSANDTGEVKLGLTQDIYISPDGRMGLRTSSPLARLDISSGDAAGLYVKQPHMIDGRAPYFDFVYPTLTLNRGSDNAGVLLALGKTNKKFYLASDGANLSFKNFNQETVFTASETGQIRLGLDSYVSPLGSVGLGVSAPEERLEVDGNFKISGPGRKIIADDDLDIVSSGDICIGNCN